MDSWISSRAPPPGVLEAKHVTGNWEKYAMLKKYKEKVRRLDCVLHT